ncbi:hypothetical protein BH11MYX1_BH11MYX1_55360 [soil metagenome]
MSSIGEREMFDKALRHPAPSYALGAQLAELFPDRHLIEGVRKLDLRSFAQAGKCKVAFRDDIYNQRDAYWAEEHGVYRIPEVVWQVVEWETAAFDVLTLRWEGPMHDAERHYVLATDRERGEAFYAAVNRWNHELRDEVLVFTDGCFAKDPKLFESIKRASFDQLVLEGSFKAQLREDFKHFLGARALYEESNVPWRRGALFIGPPGNGKTLCVKALIRELALPCLYIQSLEAQYNTPQRSIETIFKRARTQAPCILVLEDIDALLTPGTRSLFLNELDGFAQNAGVITLATTNHPERLDPSIVERPSRFDRKYHFMLPSAETRMDYVRSWNDRLRTHLQLTEEGQAKITELTEGFSFAYIQEVFVSTTMHWMTKRDQPVIAIAEEQIATLREQMTR